MTTPDPEPARTPGLEPGGEVRPGDTPPAEGGYFGISYNEPPSMRKGWAAMPLIVIMLVVVLVAVGLVGMAWVL
ncbi:DUF6480 family protein [Streptomyces sp. NPDC098781]|uniref:DUF6480 family protein n=1 Tax=Streptomyces sp. NPDC098781 TaxID=3366097 RepID=UPI0038275B4D